MKITFIEHSGFSVELEHSVLLFDYYIGDMPEFPKDKELYVFSSHQHKDHYNPKILKLEEEYPKIHYIFSSDIPIEETKKITKINPHEEKVIQDIKVETLQSTDEGVAFVVTAEGNVIYHAGDLHWWHWNGESPKDNQHMKEAYQREIQLLKNKVLDVAFVVLDPRQEDKYCLGMNYFLEHVQVKHVFPMHGFGKYQLTKHYLNCSDGRKWSDIVNEIHHGNEVFTIKERMILASGSPRRKEILEQVGLDFQVEPSAVEEVVTKVKPEDVVVELAMQKAMDVATNHNERIVIGADTIVAYEGEILGKPKDEADAYRMLSDLSGKVHSVYTGVCVVRGNQVDSFYEETKVEFYPLEEDEIKHYIQSGEPMDKAGAYGIQGKAAAFVKGIQGDYYNVVGFPVSHFLQLLKNFD